MSRNQDTPFGRIWTSVKKFNRLSARWDTVISYNLRPFTIPIYLLYCVCYHVHCKFSEIKVTTTTTILYIIAQFHGDNLFKQAASTFDNLLMEWALLYFTYIDILLMQSV